MLTKGLLPTVDLGQIPNHHVSFGHNHQSKVAMRSYAFLMRLCVAAVPRDPQAPNTYVLRPLCSFSMSPRVAHKISTYSILRILHFNIRASLVYPSPPFLPY